jgi:hypothetical protein
VKGFRLVSEIKRDRERQIDRRECCVKRGAIASLEGLPRFM